MRKNRVQGRDEQKMKAERKAAFIRVVEPRVAKALKAISLIGNCAGAGYSYNEEQVTQIKIALTKAVTVVGDKFSKVKEQQSEFKLTEK